MGQPLAMLQQPLRELRQRVRSSVLRSTASNSRRLRPARRQQRQHLMADKCPIKLPVIRIARVADGVEPSCTCNLPE